MKSLVYCLLAIGYLTTGCVRSQFTPYRGQQATWPIRPGSFATDVYQISIYHSWPERAYEVIGIADMVGAPLANMDKSAAMLAKKHGGQAAIIMERGRELIGFHSTGSTQNFGHITVGQSDTTAQHAQTMSIIIIRWKQPETLDLKPETGAKRP